MGARRFLIGTAVFSVLGLAVLITVFAVTGGLVSAAEGFLAHLERGEYEAAYACLSAEFHGNTTVGELREFAQESALAEYSDASWGSRSIYGDEGFIEGSVETKDGRYIPVEMTLLKEHDEWKIYQIDWSEAE